MLQYCNTERLVLHAVKNQSSHQCSLQNHSGPVMAACADVGQNIVNFLRPTSTSGFIYRRASSHGAQKRSFNCAFHSPWSCIPWVKHLLRKTLDIGEPLTDQKKTLLSMGTSDSGQYMKTRPQGDDGTTKKERSWSWETCYIGVCGSTCVYQAWRQRARTSEWHPRKGSRESDTSQN